MNQRTTFLLGYIETLSLRWMEKNNISIKEFNRKVQGLAPAEIRKLKHKRRVLKIRGYNKTLRTKKSKVKKLVRFDLSLL